MTCSNCSRPMRAHGRRLAEFPGTVGYGSRGLCSGCYKQIGPGPAAEKALEDAPRNRATLETWLEARRARLTV